MNGRGVLKLSLRVKLANVCVSKHQIQGKIRLWLRMKWNLSKKSYHNRIECIEKNQIIENNEIYGTVGGRKTVYIAPTIFFPSPIVFLLRHKYDAVSIYQNEPYVRNKIFCMSFWEKSMFMQKKKWILHGCLVCKIEFKWITF